MQNKQDRKLIGNLQKVINILEAANQPVLKPMIKRLDRLSGRFMSLSMQLENIKKTGIDKYECPLCGKKNEIVVSGEGLRSFTIQCQECNNEEYVEFRK